MYILLLPHHPHHHLRLIQQHKLLESNVHNMLPLLLLQLFHQLFLLLHLLYTNLQMYNLIYLALVNFLFFLHILL